MAGGLQLNGTGSGVRDVSASSPGRKARTVVVRA
jgi:hypothetical protein